MIHKWIIRSFNFSVVLQKLTLLISSSASCCFGYFFSCDNTVLLVLLGLGKNHFDLKYLFWSHKHGLSCPKSGYLPKVSLKKKRLHSPEQWSLAWKPSHLYILVSGILSLKSVYSVILLFCFVFLSLLNELRDRRCHTLYR